MRQSHIINVIKEQLFVSPRPHAPLGLIGADDDDDDDDDGDFYKSNCDVSIMKSLNEVQS